MEQVNEVIIDFKEMKTPPADLNEEQLKEWLLSKTAAMGASIKILLGMMGFGRDFSIPVKIRGSSSEVSSFTRALKGERRYMDAVKKYGLDDARTYKSKNRLDKAIQGFEKTTGIKWMIG